MSTSASGSQTVTVSRSGMEAVSFAVTSPSAGDAKRTHVDSMADHKIEFDRQLAALSQWLDQTEGLLELVTSDSSDTQGRLTVEEQLVLIEVRIKLDELIHCQQLTNMITVYLSRICIFNLLFLILLLHVDLRVNGINNSVTVLYNYFKPTLSLKLHISLLT